MRNGVPIAAQYLPYLVQNQAGNSASSSRFDPSFGISGQLFAFFPTIGVTKDGSSKVSQWNDQSVNANNATQSTSTKQFIFTNNVFNSNPGLLAASAASQYMSLSSTAGPVTDLTVFLLFQPSVTDASFQYLLFGNTTESWVIAQFGGGGAEVTGTGFTDEVDFTSPILTSGTNYLFQLRLKTSPATAELKINGASQTRTFIGGANWNAGLNLNTIGGLLRVNRYCDGYYGPVIAYDHSITDGECAKINNWFTNNGWI